MDTFCREEIPKNLIENETPRREPPRSPLSYSPTHKPYVRESVSKEFNRRPGISNAGPKKSGADAYGISKIKEGTRVSHSMFGEGVIISTRDMGGDVLYEVKFDSGITKKLMATYAKLQVLQF